MMMRNLTLRTLLLASVATLFVTGGAMLLSADDAKSGDAKATSDKENVVAAEAAEEKEDEWEPKSKRELRRMLTPLQYDVTQNEATEPAFRNRYWNNKQEGSYNCVVCGLELFTSNAKYKSGTGWPSFWAPVAKDRVAFRADNRLFYTRIEVHCKRCQAHLGHVFDDGPKPTGKRYCMNSAALKFEKKDAEQRERDKTTRE